MEAHWFYKLGPIVVGPLSLQEMQRHARDGRLRSSMPVRWGKDGQWVEASAVPRLFAAQPKAKPTPPPLPPTSRTLADRWQALRRSVAAIDLGPLSRALTGDLLPVGKARLAIGAIAVSVAVAVVSLAMVQWFGGWVVPDSGRNDEDDRVAALRQEIGRLRAEVDKAATAQSKRRETETPANLPTKVNPVAGEAKLSGRELVALVEPLVVTLRMDRRLGSGFIADESGLVITNYHVVEDAQSGTVVFQDGTSARVEGYLVVVPKRDIAVLKVTLPERHRRRALRIAVNDPRRGDAVMAFGAPLGLPVSVADGIVSGVPTAREILAAFRLAENARKFADGHDLNSTWVQTTAPISPGNSGGPLIDEFGRVLGLNTFSLNGDGSAQNLNFAIAASYLKEALAESRNTPVRDLRSISPRTQTVARPAPAPQQFVPAPIPPQPAARPDVPARMVNSTELLRDEIRLIHRIYEQRLVLIGQWETAKAQLARAQTNYGAAEADLARIRTEGAAARQRGRALEQSAAELRPAIAFARDPRIRADYQTMLNQVTQSYATWQTYYTTLQAQENRAMTFQVGLQQEAASIGLTASSLFAQSEQLRTEWLSATDAYGHLARGDYPAAVTVFSEWIVLESDNPVPYLARGLAHHNSGNDKAANEDFGRASRLDPRLAGAMIRDIRKADKRK